MVVRAKELGGARSPHREAEGRRRWLVRSASRPPFRTFGAEGGSKKTGRQGDVTRGS